MGPLTNIIEVFTGMATWAATAIGNATAIFYTAPTSDTAGSLTFVGVLAVAGLSISVFFLIMGVIQNFLHFRG